MNERNICVQGPLGGVYLSLSQQLRSDANREEGGVCGGERKSEPFHYCADVFHKKEFHRYFHRALTCLKSMS